MVNDIFRTATRAWHMHYPLSSSTDRFHIQFCLHGHKEDLRICSWDSTDHQKDCGGRENWQYYRQGMISHLTQTGFAPFRSYYASVSGSFRHVSGLVLFVHFQTILGDFQKEQEKFVQEKKSKKSGKTTGKNEKLFIPPGSVQYFWEIKFKLASLLPVNWFIRSCTVLGVNNCPLNLILQRMQNNIQTEYSQQGLQVSRAHFHRTLKPYLSFLLLAAFPHSPVGHHSFLTQISRFLRMFFSVAQDHWVLRIAAQRQLGVEQLW